MLFVAPFAAPGGVSLRNTTLMQRVTFHRTCRFVTPDALIGVNIAHAIHPGASRQEALLMNTA